MNEFKPPVLLRDQMRADLIEAYLARDISLADAAESMELSRRQCRRLVKRYREAGPEGLINRRRGKPSNCQLKDNLKAQVIKLIRTRCRGMSPTGAWRLLNAGFGLSISKETVRKLMIAENTWVAHPRNTPG
ncbi:helix-turn-helix domain-containing protein [Pantoea trifolii]|uniref:Helix-turn-helix domain-containing protein n=1 Tax=Pantoea trifolii TaxID=2968030 RepID=A0ABT1VTD9_9GAMM|nr:MULTISPECIES: helix-turn-helix domain-containing protein [unclassified Pantoea]MCQ8230401.1 helix-turn-helix domain-containing protein [Pantoea sp. MMK2]MCQ8239144.1 helix-turn-helix domain-containing protein [Pantoea sp. MMK3]